jgi:S-adenosylmethionine-dependent methyltransferase
MKTAIDNRFESAQEYAAYLQTGEGRLRLDLAWVNLQEFLPSTASGDRLKVLDLGGGTGAMAVKLAGVGFQVTIVDNSKAMLAMAESAATQAGLSDRISIVLGDVLNMDNYARTSREPSSFDVIICHNVLEYVDDLRGVLRGIKSLINPISGVVSILVRNRAGEVLKAAIKSGDLDMAMRNLTAEAVKESLYQGEARLFNPSDLRDTLAQESLEPFAERGVRVVSDYLTPQRLNDDAGYTRVLALEQKLGARPEFAAIARYTQIFARAFKGKGKLQP